MNRALLDIIEQARRQPGPLSAVEPTTEGFEQLRWFSYAGES